MNKKSLVAPSAGAPALTSHPSSLHLYTQPTPTMKTKPTAFHPSSFILHPFLLLLALATAAFGQSATWSSSSNTTWSEGANWSNSSGPGTAAGDRATFLTANGTANPNLTANATTGAVTFNGTYTLSSANASTALTLLGTGTGTGVSSAIYTANGSITNISAPIIFGSASSQRITTFAGPGSLTISGSVTKAAGDLLLVVGSGSTGMTLSGDLSIGGRVSTSGNDDIYLSGSNTAAGWDLGDAAVHLNSANALGSTGTINFGNMGGGGGLTFSANNTTDYSSRFTVSANTTYSFAVPNAAGSVTLNSALAGNGTAGLRVSGGTNGVLVLGNASNSYAGATSINGGVLSVAGIGNAGNNSHLGTNGTINIGNAANAGTLRYTGIGETTDKVINLAGTTGGATIGAENTSGLLKFTSNLTATGNGNKTLTLRGTGNGELAGNIVDSTGKLTSVTKNDVGTWTLSGSNTYTGNTTVSNGILVFRNKAAKATGAVSAASVGGIGLGVGGTGDYSSADVDSLWANTLSGFVMNANSGIAIDTTAGNFTYSTSQSTRRLTKLGTNTLTLSGTNTYNGTTTVSAGTLLLSSTGSLAAGSAVAVQSGAAIGGDGTISGNLTLDSGAKFVFDINDTPLTVGGTFALDSTFGVDDLVTSSLGAIDWSSVGLGTYTLIGTSFSFNSGNIQNFGLANAFASGGKLMYFENGSLDLVVAIPEPSTWALLAFSLTTIIILRRHRASH
jgi:autotransporter-associated beta strand protein